MAEKGGQPNNNNYSKGAIFNDALRRAIAQDDGKRIRGAAEKLLDLANDGVPWAVRELADRTDGKAAMSVVLAGDPDQPLITKIERVIVRSTDKNS